MMPVDLCFISDIFVFQLLYFTLEFANRQIACPVKYRQHIVLKNILLSFHILRLVGAIQKMDLLESIETHPVHSKKSTSCRFIIWLIADSTSSHGESQP